MRTFNSVILLLFIAGTSVNGYIQHYGVDFLNVTVHVKFSGACDVASDFTTTVANAPRGSSILNILERANTQPPFSTFEVLYGVHNTSYILVSINGKINNVSCNWYVSTDPVTSSETGFFPLSDVLVTNMGMEVTFDYKASSEEKVLPRTTSVKNANNQVPSSDIGHIDYNLQGTSPCSIERVSFPSTPLELSFRYGESALNVVETAMNIEPEYNVVLQNFFGIHYIVKSFGSHSVPGCQWCPYFTPPGGSQYPLTATISNFIIPLTGGTLIYSYEQSCGSSATADLHSIMDQYNGANGHCYEGGCDSQ
uniref:MACPF domain-containing protein n=1 Tax=Amphimedon queenslandica TaxID=400682 RepID=A0A1X7VI20_AMPQE